MNTKLPFIFMLLLSPYLAQVAQSQSCVTPSTLKFAIPSSSQNSEETVIAESVVSHIENTTGHSVELLAFASREKLGNALEKGQVDIAYTGIYTYLSVRTINPTISAFAAPVIKLSESAYPINSDRSILITHKSSGKNSIESLKGSLLAIADAGSASGYKPVRRLFFKNTGIYIEEHFQKIIFSKKHYNSVNAVKNGKVDAAFIVSNALIVMAKRKFIDINDFNILWESAPVGGLIFIYRTSLCPELRRNIKSAILTLDESVEAREWLKKYSVQTVVETTDEAYDLIRMQLGL